MKSRQWVPDAGRFSPALELLADPSFVTDDLIEAIFPLHSAIAAFDRSRSPDAMKVLMGIAPPDEFSGISMGDIDNLSGEED